MVGLDSMRISATIDTVHSTQYTVLSTKDIQYIQYIHTLLHEHTDTDTSTLSNFDRHVAWLLRHRPTTVHSM